MIRRKDDPFLFWMVGTHLVVYEIISVLRLTNVRIVRQFLCGFLRKWIQTISFVYFGKIEAIRTSEDGNLKRPFYVLVELTILRRIKILKIILRDTTIADFTYFSSAWTVNNWNDKTRQETGRQVLTSEGSPLDYLLWWSTSARFDPISCLWTIRFPKSPIW